MCASCVAQGAPYVVGSLVALRVMASSARAKRGAGAAVAVAGTDPAATATPAGRPSA